MKKVSNKKTLKPSYFYTTMQSPVGALTLIASDKGLVRLVWGCKPTKGFLAQEDKRYKPLVDAQKQLTEYFAGKRKVFDIAIDFRGTDFQKKVWNALLKIPFGKVATYGEVAKMIKHPKASRAVGSANNKNPVAIIAACHRVVGSSKKLTGYAGGVKTKAFLLKHEGAIISGKPTKDSKVI